MSALKRNITILIGIIGSFLSMQAQSTRDSGFNADLKSFNEEIQDAYQQRDPVKLGEAMCARIVLFYNSDMVDSIIKYAPEDLKELRKFEQWDRYYEIWTHLANTYLYSGQPNKALREVQQIFDDAKQRDNKYGMGIAYYTMGSVYASLNNFDESISSYQKGLDILSTIRPYPAILPDLYAYYGDILNFKHEYVKLEKLTQRWGVFLKEYIASNPELSEYTTKILNTY